MPAEAARGVSAALLIDGEVGGLEKIGRPAFGKIFAGTPLLTATSGLPSEENATAWIGWLA